MRLKQERAETRSPARARKRSPPPSAKHHTGNEVTVRSHLRHDHHRNGARRGERTDASVQRGSPGSGQGPHTGSTSDLGMERTDRRSPEAGSSGWSGQRSDPDRLLEAARRRGHKVRPCEVLQGASSHHSGGRQVRRTRPSRERAATVGSSTQVRQSTTDPTVSRAPTVAGHPTRQVGSDEGMLMAVSVWLGERSLFEARSGCPWCGARQCNVWRWL